MNAREFYTMNEEETNWALAFGSIQVKVTNLMATDIYPDLYTRKI
jgi:hypothetical protein